MINLAKNKVAQCLQIDVPENNLKIKKEADNIILFSPIVIKSTKRTKALITSLTDLLQIRRMKIL